MASLLSTNHHSNAVLIFGIIAYALRACSSVEAFASTTSLLRLLASPCCSSTIQQSLFLRTKNNDVSNDEYAPDNNYDEVLKNSRRSFLSATASTASLIPFRAYASASEKQTNISNDELKKIILSDMDKSFLVTADITRSVYDESATFTDEIDVYTMDKWIKGTKALFIPSGSRLKLEGDVDVTQSEVSFRFVEDLMFNIPFKPVCSLTGKLVLTRDENTGLIISYREYWDQSVSEVLKTAKFGKRNMQ